MCEMERKSTLKAGLREGAINQSYSLFRSGMGTKLVASFSLIESFRHS